MTADKGIKVNIQTLEDVDVVIEHLRSHKVWREMVIIKLTTEDGYIYPRSVELCNQCNWVEVL